MPPWTRRGRLSMATPEDSRGNRLSCIQPILTNYRQIAKDSLVRQDPATRRRNYLAVARMESRLACVSAGVKAQEPFGKLKPRAVALRREWPASFGVLPARRPASIHRPGQTRPT